VQDAALVHVAAQAPVARQSDLTNGLNRQWHPSLITRPYKFAKRFIPDGIAADVVGLLTKHHFFTLWKIQLQIKRIVIDNLGAKT
jgi:hypothetical protein